MLKIGLTGGIGCGKSTVCKIFSDLGVPIIDTDALARQAVTPGSECLNRLVQNFGNDILLTDGILDRKKLRDIVFTDNQKLKELESIVHPEIRRLLRQQLNTISSPYVIIAIPLLIEKSWNNDVDRILVVDCSEESQTARASSRDNRQPSDIQKIMDAQATRQQRLAVADDVIHNDTDLDSVYRQVEKLHLYYTQLV